jgi:hypothetical protein
MAVNVATTGIHQALTINLYLRSNRWTHPLAHSREAGAVLEPRTATTASQPPTAPQPLGQAVSCYDNCCYNAYPTRE